MHTTSELDWFLEYKYKKKKHFIFDKDRNFSNDSLVTKRSEYKLESWSITFNDNIRCFKVMIAVSVTSVGACVSACRFILFSCRGETFIGTHGHRIVLYCNERPFAGHLKTPVRPIININGLRLIGNRYPTTQLSARSRWKQDKHHCRCCHRLLLVNAGKNVVRHLYICVDRRWQHMLV